MAVLKSSYESNYTEFGQLDPTQLDSAQRLGKGWRKFSTRLNSQ